MKEAPRGQRVVIAGGLVIQHHVVGTGNAHEVIAPRSRQKQEQVIGGILVGSGVIGVADITTHGQSKQFTHEMVFEPGTDDLSLVVQIFRPDETNDAVDEKRLEGAGDAVSSSFECQLINSMVRFGGESTALASFEVHRVVPNPADIALAMMFLDLFVTLSQHVQRDSKAAVGRLRTCDGLEEKVDRRIALHGGQLGADMCQAAELGGDFIRVHQTIQRHKD